MLRSNAIRQIFMVSRDAPNERCASGSLQDNNSASDAVITYHAIQCIHLSRINHLIVDISVQSFILSSVSSEFLSILLRFSILLRENGLHIYTFHPAS